MSELKLAWRNLVTEWHLNQGMPDCGCDDDTADTAFCASSIAYADLGIGDLSDPALAGPPDLWRHNIWVAAWGYNATLVASAADYQLPRAPEGTAWLLARMLIAGRTVMEIVLMKPGERTMTILARHRVNPEPTLIAARARRMVQEILN